MTDYWHHVEASQWRQSVLQLVAQLLLRAGEPYQPGLVGDELTSYSKKSIEKPSVRIEPRFLAPGDSGMAVIDAVWAAVLEASFDVDRVAVSNDWRSAPTLISPTRGDAIR